MAQRTEGATPITKPVRKYYWTVPDERPTAIDLFCGAGGMTVGLKDAGFRVIGAIDIDPVAIRTYRLNHRKNTVWQCDIRELSPRNVLDELSLRPGELHLLAGCPPCQGFSAIRTRNSGKAAEDPRNDLIHEFVEFARVLKPKTVMMENVPGLAKDDRFRLAVRRLRGMGYHVRSGVLDAKAFRVPQRRRRLIMMAARSARPELPEASEGGVTVRDAIEGLPKPDGSDELHGEAPKRAERILELIKRIPKDGGSRSSLGDDFILDCHKRVDGFKDVYGRMKWDDVSPTITSGCINPSKGRFLHPDQDRAITLREAALLQTFPRAYKFSMERGRYKVAELIGNALPPQFIRKIALQLRPMVTDAPT